MTVINLTGCACVDVFQDFIASEKPISGSFGTLMKLYYSSQPLSLNLEFAWCFFFYIMNLTEISVSYDLLSLPLLL